MKCINVINKIIGGFDKIISKLHVAIEACNHEILRRNETIELASNEKAEISDTIVRAEKLMKNLKKLYE